MVRKFVFLVPALSQPRCIKRIVSIHKMGYPCDVYGYKRGKYDVNVYPTEISVNILDSIKDGDYIRKAIKGWKDLSKVVSSNKNENIAYYAFGFFQAFVCAVRGVKFIYEISDIFYAYPRLNKIKWLLKIIDKLLIRKSSLTVMTSGGFQEFFNVKYDKILLVPNKVSDRLTTIPRKALSGGVEHLRFGFVGSIKYESIYRFAETIGEYYPNYRFDFFGSAVDEEKMRVDEIVSRYNNVLYHGVYKNPEDLEGIYSIIDVVVACYDVNSENERIAEPNKLYESLYFCKPIIVSDGIYLARRVKELECGYTIDASSKENIRLLIKKMSDTELISISKRELDIPANDIVNDTTGLANAIKKYVYN